MIFWHSFKAKYLVDVFVQVGPIYSQIVKQHIAVNLITTP